MALVKKIPRKVMKPVAKELLSYGINNELRRYIGKGKKVVPRIIPFVNTQGPDVNESLKAQGINPSSFSGTPTEQFDLPAAFVLPATKVKRINIKTPQDSLFFMHSIRYTASLTTDVTYPFGGNPLKSMDYSYDKWLQNTGIGTKLANQVTYNGTSTVTLAAVYQNVIKEGMVVTIPVYDSAVVDPLASAPIGIAQGEIDNVTATTFDIINLIDNKGESITISWSGAGPIFWPTLMNFPVTPYYHFLKVALIANSPKKLSLYGGLANVPSLDDNRESHVHLERLYASTMQGANDGYNQVERKHLFPMDATINIEVENTFSQTLNINGYVFGYQIFERGQ